MTVAYTFRTGGTREQYEKVSTLAMGDGGTPDGLILHAAGEEPTGEWHVIEIWESDAQRDRWMQEKLMPALQQNGVDTSGGPPAWTRLDVHHLVER